MQRTLISGCSWVMDSDHTCVFLKELVEQFILEPELGVRKQEKGFQGLLSVADKVKH